MILDVATVAHGRPATRALARAIARARGESGPLAPVTVVVPSNFAGLAVRRVLGSGVVEEAPRGLANVSFVTPLRLAELCAGPPTPEARPLTNPVLGAAVRRVLAEQPGRFASVATHHATERALAALYAELSPMSTATREVLRGAGVRGAEAVRVHDAIAARLTAFDDEDAVADRAAASLRSGSAPSTIGHLVWFLPEPTRPALLDVVAAALGAVPASVVVALTGDEGADAPVTATCAAAGIEVAGDAHARITPPDGGRIISVTDADEEVRAAVRHVVCLAEAGVDLQRIGIFFPLPDPYLRALGQHLREAGIPASGPSPHRLSASVAGRTLLAALALPARGWRRDHVIALLAGAPVHHEGRPVPATRWDAISRAAGVVGGIGSWSSALDAHAGRLARRAESDARAEVRERLALDHADTVALAAFVTAMRLAVDAVAGARGWSAKVDAAGALLDGLLPDASSWPEPEQAARHDVAHALSRLATLDEVEPQPDEATFRRALIGELDVARRRDGRFGHGVLYGPLAGAIGQDLDAVIVLGMAEGLCPAPRTDDSLLPDAVRSLVPATELPRRTARLHDQHRALLAALAAAPEGADRRVLIHPRGDLRRGREQLPSRWLLPTASALAGRTVRSTDFADLAAPVVDVVASFADGLADGSAAGSTLERDLAVVLAHVDAGGDPIDHPATDSVGRGLHAAVARRSGRLTEFDGNLAGHAVPSPATGEVLSATRLETWAGCGFRYLMAHVLGVGVRDEPERILELGHLDRGSAAHEILERFLAEQIATGPPDPDQAWSAADRARLADLADEVLDGLERRGRTGRTIPWRQQRRAIHDQLQRMLTHDDRHRADHRVRPAHVELAFGLGGADPVELTLDDGRTLRFAGRIDRVDVGDGAVVVSDYKTGKVRGPKDPYADDPVLAGTALQLGLYAEAVRASLGAGSVDTAYWFLQADADPRKGYAWTDDRRRRFLDVVEGIVDGIEAGTFDAVPGEWDSWRGTHTNCTHCPYDTVCPRDRGDHFEATVDAPERRVRWSLRAGPTPEAQR